MIAGPFLVPRETGVGTGTPNRARCACERSSITAMLIFPHSSTSPTSSSAPAFPSASVASAL